MACDEEVVRSTGASHAHYGAMLLEVMGQPHRPVGASRLMASVAESYATVRRRLVAIRRVRAGSPPGGAGSPRVQTVAAAFLVIASAAAIIPWRLTARAAAPDQVARQDAPRSPLPRLTEFAARTSDTTTKPHELEPGGETDRPLASVLPPVAAPVRNAPDSELTPANGKDGDRMAASVSTFEHSDARRVRAAPGSQRSGTLTAADERPSELKFAAPQVATMPGSSLAQSEPGKETAPNLWDTGSWRNERSEKPPSVVLAIGKELGGSEALRGKLDLWDHGKQAEVEKALAFKKQLGRDLMTGKPGVLLMPKPFVDASARFGWRSSPLFREPKRANAELVPAIDERVLRKLMMAAQERGIDPAEFKKMVALASMDGAFDPRVLKKLLGQAHQEAPAGYRLPDDLPRARTEKELFRDRQLDELKRRATGEPGEKAQDDALKSEAAPGD
jgi:hypothetical protein